MILVLFLNSKEHKSHKPYPMNYRICKPFQPAMSIVRLDESGNSSNARTTAPPPLQPVNSGQPVMVNVEEDEQVHLIHAVECSIGDRDHKCRRLDRSHVVPIRLRQPHHVFPQLKHENFPDTSTLPLPIVIEAMLSAMQWRTLDQWT